jgi:hypothetical protein
MKKIAFVFLIIILFSACNSHSNGPDVSGIKVDIQVERFDQQFFTMDTLVPEKSLSDLQINYAELLPVFFENILGLNDSTVYPGVKRFIRLNKFISDSVNKVFNNTDFLKKDFEQAFRYVKYYFPGYKIPRIITIIGPVDLLAQTATGDLTPNFLGKDFLGISLQFYLGKDFSLYRDDYFIANVAPEYRSRRFDKKYIVADAMKLVTDDIFPDRSRGKSLIEQMIEKGKQWWLLDKFLPSSPDSVKTGYTQRQLEWCNKNEGLIWNNIITNEKDIFTTDPAAIQTYIGEAPFTQTMPSVSPGNIGQWVGWQIVKKFAEKNSSMTIDEIIKTESRKILEEAKYKPK